MTITLEDLDYLTSDLGAAVLGRLAGENLAEENTLKLLTALRRETTPQQAGAALELARLRQKAVSKFGTDAAKMYFTREALEQASDPSIRRVRAESFKRYRRIIDACCSIGADALAFAQAGAAEVLGLDIDPVRVAMAQLNAAALGITNARFEVADVRAGVPQADLIFFDPARRDEQGKRIFDVERYEPPLSTIRGWEARCILVKLSPGVQLAQLEPYGGRVEFISVRGDLKEAVLTVDDEKRASQHCAVLLGDNAMYPKIGELGGWCHDPLLPKEAPISEPRGWLVEPDPAIIRAGLVADLALELGGALLDPEIAYITTDEAQHSPWVRAWEIIDWMPFNVKKLRAYLREQDVGTVTVKKRGTAVTPEELIAKLKLNGSGSRTIVLTRCRGEQIMMICRDLMTTQGG